MRPGLPSNATSPASLFIARGETLLFECGEGTQRQMMRYGVSFALSEIFFTHFHADHFLGVIGLIRTLGLQGRPEPLFLYGPRGAKKVLTTAMQLGVERVPFPIEITEVKAGDTIKGKGKRDEGTGMTCARFPLSMAAGRRLDMSCESTSGVDVLTWRKRRRPGFRRGRFGANYQGRSDWSLLMADG